jgi:hypothetical protein
VARRLTLPFYEHPDVATYVHYDAARSPTQRAELERLLQGRGRFRFVASPVHCQWGEHSLVEATRRLMELALADDFGATHVVLLSASCVPYRPVASLQAFLAERPDTEFIQAQDISRQRWIQDGLERERYEYYFPFNYRGRKAWFEWATARQRELGVRRKVPDGLNVHFGSQWFCLTRATVAAVAKDLARSDIQRWLRWSWIPDEFAIQTLVRKACPPARIAGHNLTYYEFNARGQPLVLEDDHLSHLLAQPFFFARKVAAEARRLEAQVADYTTRPEADQSYFLRIGQATSHFARFQAEVAAGSALRAHVGTIIDGWRGPMEGNRRRYYVLHASSRDWLLALISAAARDRTLPIFELPFDPMRPPVMPGDVRFGVRSTDAARRDYEPQAFMFELVNAHPSEPSAFGLQIDRPSRTRDFIRWDAPAVLIDCDPPLTREQRAAALLDGLAVAQDKPVIEAALLAMRKGAPLPHDAFLGELQGAAACQTAALRELGAALGDRTLLALRTAYHAMDPTPYHPEAGAAWRQFWK